MSNRMRTIKSLPLIAVLFTCVVILSSAAIFASEESSPSSEVTSWLAPDLDDVQAKAVAEEIYDKLSEGTRSDATITDVYNILRYDILPGLKGSVSNSNYSLPRIAYYSEESWGKLTDIRNLLYMPYVGSDPTMRSPFWYQVSSSNYSLSDLQGMTWARVGDILSTLNLSNSYLSAISSQLSGFNWQSAGTYLGAINSSTGQGTSSWVTGVNDWTFGFQFNSSFYRSDQPNLIRLYVPFDAWTAFGSANIDLVDIYRVSGNSWVHAQYDYNNVFIEPSPDYGTYIYLFDFKDFNLGTSLYFRCVYTGSGSPQMSGDRSGVVQILSFDSDSYQQIKQAFYQQKAALAQVSMSSDVNRLADYLADPDKIAAEQASQGVIDDTLDGFTGSGSAAAKGSDIGSMKNISGSVQSGLDTGAGVSNATNVFSLNGGFWGWFSQSNSDLINNPYPAPVVTNNRKSSGDDVVDFLSDNQSQVKDLLGESKW